ncbi:Vacuolar-sorting receptor 2 [Monoraphidium neglectum]|uniref:Vacuolar-sorting receptor 2 n=1 Tax=Monoraphidium neglectum TaxID=145388 RepID=A0A0D2MGL4_9CHLO|nr:Vacuolar-sorting receptor 2 [Monoraphidium neglectum]KIZ02215.1 Vacuolar-sorting receptor 2 [Monoraphidium neglectum]|eukprot:XP_013901234.1 Vacuolar-sorting receptor 2 [Monoraphidium neglectum]
MVFVNEVAPPWFDVALANFGVPKYGALLSGQLVYPNADASYGWHAVCTPADCSFGCLPFNESTPPLVLKKEPGKRYIMLLDRGPREGTVDLKKPCYFLDKAWNSQLAGADAVLVVNDREGDLSTAVVPQDEGAARQLQDLTISAGLISQQDGASLKALLKKGPVTVALNWTDLIPKAQKAGGRLAR